jgi:hypothetical protein
MVRYCEVSTVSVNSIQVIACINHELKARGSSFPTSFRAARTVQTLQTHYSADVKARKVINRDHPARLILVERLAPIELSAAEYTGADELQ